MIDGRFDEFDGIRRCRPVRSLSMWANMGRPFRSGKGYLEPTDELVLAQQRLLKAEGELPDLDFVLHVFYVFVYLY